jgi:hypothetical protein
MKQMAISLLFVGAAAAQISQEHPTGPRITPPTLNSVTPLGGARGTTFELTLEGLNLAKASAIYFSDPAVKGKIARIKELPDLPDIRLGSAGTQTTVDVGPLPPRNQVTVEVEISPNADIGPVSFRLLTPLGTSPEGRFLVEPYYGEAPDKEPNDTPERAFETFLPAILTGTISRPGDVDWFKISVRDSEQLVFENSARLIGSTLQPLVAIYSDASTMIAEYGKDGGTTGSIFAHKFEKGGTYYIRVTDFEGGGKASAFYRIKVGRFALVTSVWPLGIEQGRTFGVKFAGFNLPAAPLPVNGTPSSEDEDAVFVRPSGAGKSFNRVKLALGREPEVLAMPGGLVNWPATLNGVLEKPGASHDFRFRAEKGEQVILEVNARRLGSELDSSLEILDAQGHPVPLGVARAVWDTYTVLSDRDSASRGIRIQAWNALAVGDYLMIGNEIVRVETLPETPDNDLVAEGFGGQRLTFFGTTAEAHAVDKPVYKVQIHPPGSKFAPNGLPQANLYYRNDDGGPGFGKDSNLVFDPPATGEYTVRLRDVSGMGGPLFAYRLTLRKPRPDFRLSISPRNPNVPAGGAIPLTVTAQRLDGFDGPIDITLQDLPPGLKATAGQVGKGQVSGTLLLSASESARLDGAAALKASGRARIDGREVVHAANPEDPLKLIALMPRADIRMVAGTREVVIEPGARADVLVSVLRQNGFGGRVPVEVRNLPPRVRVIDVGLNGVLLNEDESKRGFTLEALPTAEPLEQWIYISGAIETRSPQQNSYASEIPVLLKVKAKTTVARQ